ncbi:MAG: hypothetical protein HXY20_07095 [Acidobacteria bacterium]|nr:hypothetical protein [Acidobacteriota bacterium]
MDPIGFERSLKVTIQAPGRRSGGRYLRLRDNNTFKTFWYQKEPHAQFARLPACYNLEVE